MVVWAQVFFPWVTALVGKQKMEANPRVSVITPAYNASRYIAETIQSILGQTFDNFELIVVDDGSTDNTAKLVRGFSDQRIRYFYQANSERSVARNRGVELAQGELLAFLDADDLYLPSKLASQVQAMDSLPAIGLIAGGHRYIDEHGNLLAVFRPWDTYPTLDLATWLSACPIWLPHILLHRDWFIRVGGFDQEMSYAEDYDFLLRLANAGCIMEWDKEIVCSYRLHADNTIRQAERMTQGHQRALQKLFERPDLPTEIKNKRDQVFRNFYLNSALRAYGANDLVEGSRYLEKYLSDQNGSHDDQQWLVQTIVKSLCNPALTSQPAELVEEIWDHLPEQAGSLRSLRSLASSAVAKELFFEAYHRGDQKEMRRMLMQVIRTDARLVDRGMISLFIRNIF
jgi:glycosyltransferase involved in cell wall biosynthesis